MLKVIRKQLKDLHADPANANRHPANNLRLIASSITTFGQVEPLVVQAGTGRVIGGNGRLEAMLSLGMKEADVVELDVDDHKATTLAIALNRTAKTSEWDDETLASLLQSLDKEDREIAGFSDSDLSELLERLTPDVEIKEDEVPEPPVDPVTKPGDLWLLGEHRVLCGDSTKAEDVGRLMGGDVVGLMVTDPPYGVGYEGGQANDKKRETLRGDDKTDVFDAGLFAALKAVPSGAWYIWHADKFAAPVYAAISRCGFDVRALIIWNKLKAHYGAPSAHYCQKHEPCLYAVKGSAGFCGPSNEVTVWDIEQPHKNEHHPTQKPVICMARAIRNHESKSVYDPFLGSGTTLIAADQLGRKCYGMEISPQYCDVIVKRWETLTGRKADLAPR